MTIPQAKFREVVFQLLYSKTHGDPEERELVNLMMRELKVTRKVVKQALERVEAVLDHCEELDEHIREVSTSFAFERIQAVEKTLLRLGIYEILHDPEIPAPVAITEAMRMAKKFSSAEASGFVNALLDAVYKKSQGESVDNESLEASTKLLVEAEELATKMGEERPSEED